jgi:hypothetical protein
VSALMALGRSSHSYCSPRLELPVSLRRLALALYGGLPAPAQFNCSISVRHGLPPPTIGGIRFARAETSQVPPQTAEATRETSESPED